MNIAVYCSSSNSIAENYLQTAHSLGEWIAKNGHTLVFGGATGGSMSAVSEGAASAGGKIIGVIPNAVKRMNRQSPLCTELVAVKTMSERKAQMQQLADVFVVLAGSFGTLDEMFDVAAAGVVGEHRKPLIVINENGFYNCLISQIDRMRQEKFIPVESE
ncbi:MAG: TIGR00730 family Rossman fold protein, partial [Paludibacter sp.]|nr:TIGR00730 family Rossman fold protein [Paludibacter sp.]